MMKTEELSRTLQAAVTAAIREVGVERFKETSLFMSSLRIKSEKLAA